MSQRTLSKNDDRVLTGTRGAAITQAGMASVIGLLFFAVAASNFHENRFLIGTMFMLLSLFMIAVMTIEFIRAKHPNEVILSPSGITFRTFYNVRSWAWLDFTAVVGRSSRGHLSLEIKQCHDRCRRVSIGTWDPSFGTIIVDYAASVGHHLELRGFRPKGD